jgi:hypothetical protein
MRPDAARASGPRHFIATISVLHSGNGLEDSFHGDDPAGGLRRLPFHVLRNDTTALQL